MKFTKMQGIGNDYVYVNGFTEKVEDKAAASRFVSDRHFGIGSDGLIFINPSEVADCEMEMYNSDGSRSEMCGNGVRCVAKFAYENGIAKKSVLTVETLAGIKTIELKFDEKGTVVGAKVNMGAPILKPELVPCDIEKFEKIDGEDADAAERFAARRGTVSGTYDIHERVMQQPLVVDGTTYLVSAVSMGNPHAIVYIDTDVRNFPLEQIGPKFETHPAFPRRTNTEFVRVLDRNTLEMRVWERGAGETLACGTGACGVAVSSMINGLVDHDVTIHLLGGDLHITWSGDPADPVFMEGAATNVFTGEIEL